MDPVLVNLLCTYFLSAKQRRLNSLKGNKASTEKKKKTREKNFERCKIYSETEATWDLLCLLAAAAVLSQDTFSYEIHQRVQSQQQETNTRAPAI